VAPAPPATAPGSRIHTVNDFCLHLRVDSVSVIAEFSVAGDGVGVIGALEAAPDVRLDVERSVTDDAEQFIVFAWGSGGGLDAFEAALPEEDSVESFEVVDDLGDERLYLFRLPRSEVVGVHRFDRRVGASRLAMTGHVDGVDFRLRLPDREALSEYLALLRGEGLSVSLQAVYDGDRAETSRYGLSEKQRRTLSTAVGMGYFSVPREAPLTELAERVGVSEQAASERLRRGIDNLVTNTIGAENP